MRVRLDTLVVNDEERRAIGYSIGITERLPTRTEIRDWAMATLDSEIDLWGVLTTSVSPPNIRDRTGVLTTNVSPPNIRDRTARELQT